ncbi:MAG: alpha-amylase family glycosyl hydrolase, partial [Bacillota bacterium]|nr:alpha-amylase family glycosyl hydrolase [Bacillota bacterium]
MKTKKILSIILMCCLLTVVFTVPFSYANAVTTQQSSTGTNSYSLADNIQDGVILHCWNWSYNTIKNNLLDIANAGYTAVQVSPVQQPKDYNGSYTDVNGQWWKMYQPVTLSFSDGNTWLGTKNDFSTMCTAAHYYGIKVIVDIV